MTQENKKENISEELVRAKECLTEAEILSSHELYAGAVSRLYYYVLHSVHALLLTKGMEPKTHPPDRSRAGEGALRVLSMHFVKPGIISSDTSHIFARLMKYREEADYNPSYVFTKDDYPRFKREADVLFGQIMECLRTEGMVE